VQTRSVLVGLAAISALAVVLWLGRTTPQQREAHPEAPGGEVGLVDVHVRIAPAMTSDAASTLAMLGAERAFNAIGGAEERGIVFSERTARASDLGFWCNVAVPIGREDASARLGRALDACEARGAVGVFVPRSVGLGIREGERLLLLDDDAFDPLFAGVAERELPLLLEAGAPASHFAPLEGNPRAGYLRTHPEAHFHGARPDGGTWPTHSETVAALERRLDAHPELVVVATALAHVDAERARALLDAHPNLHLEIGGVDAGDLPDLVAAHPTRILFGSGLRLTGEGAELDGEPVDDLPATYQSRLDTLRSALAPPLWPAVRGGNAARVLRL